MPNAATYLHREHGTPFTVMTSLIAAIGAIYLTAASYFCMEGAVRSLIDIHHRNETDGIVGIRPLGDVGGWVMLPLFSVLTAGNVAMRIIREGEYLQLHAVCRDWIIANQAAISSDFQFHEQLYGHINNLVDKCQSNGLSIKGVPQRRLVALGIYTASTLSDQGEQLRCDRAIEQHLSALATKIDKKLSPSRYFQRIAAGLLQLREQGLSTQLTAAVMGAALPMTFLGLAALSYTGEVGLGVELFSERQELTDTGHFGEWPLNALEALSAMVILHVWSLLNEGDFAVAKKVYAKYLSTMRNDPMTYNLLCNIANSDLNERAARCQAVKLPGDYHFETI
jgi:hypothetical protein